MLMSRPRHDLSWAAVRRRWARMKPPKVKSVQDDSYHKSPSAPLLKNIFEWTSNHVDQVDAERPSFTYNRQRSDSLTEICVPSAAKIYRSSPLHDLSKVPCRNDMDTIRSELRVIISQLTLLTQHQKQQGANDDESQDWKFVAMVIDRFLLILFTLFMIVFTVLTVIWTPNIFNLR